MVLFWKPEGPRIKFERTYNHSYPIAVWDEMFIVDDLNPEKEIKFRMSSWELFCLGLNCIWASIWP